MSKPSGLLLALAGSLLLAATACQASQDSPEKSTQAADAGQQNPADPGAVAADPEPNQLQAETPQGSEAPLPSPTSDAEEPGAAPGGAAQTTEEPTEPEDPSDPDPGTLYSPPPGKAMPRRTVGPTGDPRLKVGVIPGNCNVPKINPPLEGHPGDDKYFCVDSDDYIVWVTTPTNGADQDYRLATFDADGRQKLSLMKYVFASEDGAKGFAATDDRLIQLGKVVYYPAWMGPASQYKDGVLELTKDAQRYVSKP